MLDNPNDNNDVKLVPSTVAPSISHVTSSDMVNLTETSYINWPSKLNFTTAVTGFYVFACLSAVIIVYFVIKAIR